MNSKSSLTMRKSSRRQNGKHPEHSPASQQPADLKTDEIVHDLMNLLAGIRLFAESALRVVPLKSTVQGMMEQISAASGEAGELCSSLRAGGRSAPRHRRELFNLSALVECAAPLLMASAADGTALRFELSPDPAVIRANRNDVRQVLLNLVLNATQALEGRQGEVVVSTGIRDIVEDSNGALVAGKRVTGRHSFLDVSDTGCGMNDLTRKRLFEPYFTTKRSGHGLGMSAILRIISAHGGSIQVRSTPGAGTSIRVLFPSTQQSEGRPLDLDNNVTDHDFEGARAPAGTLLLIDDDRTIRMLGESLLKSRGWSVMTTAGGEEAVELVRKHHAQITAIVLDMTLVGMSGVETFRQLRRITSTMPVIVLSGTNQHELEKCFGSDLPQAFLSKPFSIDALIETMNTVLRDDPGTCRFAFDGEPVGEQHDRAACSRQAPHVVCTQE